MKKRIFLLLAMSAGAAYAAVPPFFTITTETGAQNPWLADVWWPAWQSQSNYLFTDLTAHYSPNQYNQALEAGGIYRQKIQGNWAWGGYAYTSYNRAVSGEKFYTLNPGLEFLNQNWHLSLNGYLPLGTTEKTSGNAVWANSVGIYDYVNYQGHDEYDQQMKQTTSTGAGVDFITGYRFPALKNFQLAAGSYYFNMPHHPVGFVAKASTPTFKHVSFDLTFTHDPLTHNSVNLGISAHFGGSQAVGGDWINQPVQHDLPSITQTNTIPFLSAYRAQGQELVEQDNIWFFNQNGTAYADDNGLQNCTYEHPCSGVSSNIAQNIANLSSAAGFKNSPDLYFASGDYATGSLVLYGNESLIGRSNNYLNNASGNDRPLLAANGIIVDGTNGNQSNTIANFWLVNNGGSNSAIRIANSQNAYLNNLQIGLFNSEFPEYNFFTGIVIKDSQNVSLNDSHLVVNNFLSGLSEPVQGLVVDGAQNLVLQNTAVSSLAIGNNLTAVGITVLNNSNITIADSQFKQEVIGNNATVANLLGSSGVNTNFNLSASSFTANAKGNDNTETGVGLSGSSKVNIHDSSFAATLTGNSGNQIIQNFLLYENAQVNMSNSSVTGNAESTTGEAATSNFYLNDNSTINLTNNHLYANGNSALVTGSTNITATDNSVANVTGGTLETDMAGGPSTGEPSGAVAIWALNNSQVNLNGAQVIAKSNNNFTNAVTVESQDDSEVSIDNSTLTSYQESGNSTGLDSSVIVAGDSSKLNINNSSLIENAAGESGADVSIVNAYNNTVLHITNSIISAYNNLTPSGSGSLSTIGANAFNTSAIYLNHVTFNLNGNNPEPTVTSGGGQIIIN